MDDKSFIISIITNPGDFLKTNLTKFAVIWLKRGQKAGFFAPEKLEEITLTKEKERRKRTSEYDEIKGRGENMVALLVFIMGTLEIAFGRKKKLFDGRGPFSSNRFSEILLEL